MILHPHSSLLLEILESLFLLYILLDQRTLLKFHFELGMTEFAILAFGTESADIHLADCESGMFVSALLLVISKALIVEMYFSE